MLKKTIAATALALVVSAPAMAAVTALPTSLGGTFSFLRDATRVYVLPTGTALLPVIERFQFTQPVAGSAGQPFATLPGLSTLTSLSSQGSTKLTSLALIPTNGKAAISKFTLVASNAKATAPLSSLTSALTSLPTSGFAKLKVVSLPTSGFAELIRRRG